MSFLQKQALQHFLHHTTPHHHTPPTRTVFMYLFFSSDDGWHLDFDTKWREYQILTKDCVLPHRPNRGRLSCLKKKKMAGKLRNFVIFGAAGSGKGTIASKIVADFSFKHVRSSFFFAMVLSTRTMSSSCASGIWFQSAVFFVFLYSRFPVAIYCASTSMKELT